MKKSQRDNYTLSEDFEDLTLFANESFDTQDVDLFEFTSEESSPLTRLKSIILSLDWEINDEILQELSDEVLALGPMWEGDKVAEVYLQGLAKIGNYIQTKGAYAHPNSIKLLLTFFYNFEKIISSPDITGDQITQLLKGDVRKFKILQYQITQSEIGEPGAEEEVALIPTEDDQPVVLNPEDATSAQLLKASILGLDWEVTEESLRQFHKNLQTCQTQLSDKKAAVVLLQGLQALGDYIADEKAHSHPDAFTLLHSFSEALDKVTSDEELADEETQELLVSCINRLNSLKMVIATPGASEGIDEDMIAGVVDEISSPFSEQPEEEPVVEETAAVITPVVEEVFEAEPEEEEITLGDEIDSLFGMESKPAMETANEQYPDEILPPDAIHPVDDELADDLIGAQLSSKRGLAPALSDSDEESGYSDSSSDGTAEVDEDLAMQLDFLFADDEPESEEPVAEMEKPVLTALEDEEDSGPIAALADVEFSLDEEQSREKESQNDVPDEISLDIEGKLDSFFLDSDDQLPEEAHATSQDAEANEQALFFDEQSGPIAALADSDEEAGFSEEETVASLSNSPLDEIEEKLDFFFGDEPEELAEDTPEVAPALNDAVNEPQEEMTPAAAPGDEPAEENSELSGALDAFFETTEPADAKEKSAKTDSLTEALEATLDEEPAAKVAPDYEGELASLGAILPAAVRALDRGKLNQAEEMLASLVQTSPTAEHKSLAELLLSVVTMLSRLPAKSEKKTEKLVNSLYEQLMAKEVTPSTLSTAISQFTGWMQQAAQFMPLVPTASAEGETESEVQYSAKELYFELAQLKQYINDEFAKVRHHLEHHH